MSSNEIRKYITLLESNIVESHDDIHEYLEKRAKFIGPKEATRNGHGHVWEFNRHEEAVKFIEKYPHAATEWNWDPLQQPNGPGTERSKKPNRKSQIHVNLSKIPEAQISD